MSRLSPKTRARLRTFRYYYHWNIGTKFSELRTKTDSVASGIGPSQSPHPCRNGAEAVKRLIGRTRASDRKANIAEHAFAYTLLDCIIVDEEHVRQTLRFHGVHTIGERTQFAL